jgi:hypothetical protein
MFGIFKNISECLNNIRQIFAASDISPSRRYREGEPRLKMRVRPGACSFCLGIVGAILGVSLVLVDHIEPEPASPPPCQRGHAHTLTKIFPTQEVLDAWEEALKKEEKPHRKISAEEERGSHLKNQMASIFMVKIPKGHGNPSHIDRQVLSAELSVLSGLSLKVIHAPLELNNIKEPGSWVRVELPEAMSFEKLVPVLAKIKENYPQHCPQYALAELEATPGERLMSSEEQDGFDSVKLKLYDKSEENFELNINKSNKFTDDQKRAFAKAFEEMPDQIQRHSFIWHFNFRKKIDASYIDEIQKNINTKNKNEDKKITDIVTKTLSGQFLEKKVVLPVSKVDDFYEQSEKPDDEFIKYFEGKKIIHSLYIKNRERSNGIIQDLENGNFYIFNFEFFKEAMEDPYDLKSNLGLQFMANYVASLGNIEFPEIAILDYSFHGLRENDGYKENYFFDWKGNRGVILFRDDQNTSYANGINSNAPVAGERYYADHGTQITKFLNTPCEQAKYPHIKLCGLLPIKNDSTAQNEEIEHWGWNYKMKWLRVENNVANTSTWETIQGINMAIGQPVQIPLADGGEETMENWGNARVINISLNFIAPRWFPSMFIPSCGSSARREFYESIQDKKVVIAQAEGNNIFFFSESQGWYTHDCPYVIGVLGAGQHHASASSPTGFFVSDGNNESVAYPLTIHRSSSRPPKPNQTCYVATYSYLMRSPLSFQGTSLATPVVAAMAFWLKTVSPSLGVKEICDLIKRGSEDIDHRFYFSKWDDRRFKYSSEEGGGIGIGAGGGDMNDTNYIPFLRMYETLRLAIEDKEYRRGLATKPQIRFDAQKPEKPSGDVTPPPS